MSFTSVMTFLCVSYIFVYAGMIAYDLFFTKEAVDLTPKVEEQEIDISDEAKTFHPVMIEKEGKEKSLVASIASELSKMTGGIEMDDLGKGQPARRPCQRLERIRTGCLMAPVTVNQP